MFGYIRPMTSELKVREFHMFKACYCGLCHALGGKYGAAARFALNYELVFLAMLLWGENDTPAITQKRCAVSPCRSKACCTRNAALDTCAGYNVILSWWKLRDSIADERFFKGLPYRLAAVFFAGAYKKAADEFPEFDKSVRKELGELAKYEAGCEASLDGAADKFARILCAAARDIVPEEKRRALTELLYHMGRWIYIADAYDDYAGDIEAGRYNAVASRFPPEDGRLPPNAKERLETTLTHSNKLLCSAFELTPENPWTQTLRNTIYLGMPNALERILNGKWKRTGGHKLIRNGLEK